MKRFIDVEVVSLFWFCKIGRYLHLYYEREREREREDSREALRRRRREGGRGGVGDK